MTKNVFVMMALLLAGVFMKAQGDMPDVLYAKQTIVNKKPIPDQYLREADIMWSKTVWRTIQLKEKINLPLYYPTIPIGDRMSLIDVLLWAIQNQGLTAYGEFGNNEFANALTMKDIEERFGVSNDTIWVEDVNNPDGPPIKKIVENNMISSEVKEYILKELWFFDKQRSKLEVRIIGICPVRVYSKQLTEDMETDEDETLMKKKLFWVYFPEARKILANHEVFNPYNNKEAKSFDDIFQIRMFSGYINQESNLCNNRAINDYTMGANAMLEAERIATSISNYEQSLWEY